MRPKALFLCNKTLNMPKPWLDAGIECWIVDIQHPAGEHREDNLVTVGADVLTWMPPQGPYIFAAAFPPCTHMAVSGARWFRSKGLKLAAQAFLIAERCREICEWTGAPWMLENPVSTLSTYWREPDYTFNPCDYGGYLDPPGDAYTKKTCLWTGGGFVMPEKRPVEPVEGSRMHLLPPSVDRADKRSETPAGFARAVFEANCGVIKEAR